jgi:2-oxoglutarate ferredoxin oxidoreductase subunit beta
MASVFSTRSYVRNLRLPFCPGCGLFSLSDSFLKAVHDLGYEDLSGFCFASGIGCASWIPSPYYLADSIHTLHGRSIPVATSVKLVKPELNVVVFGGDGDIVGIGLSHFIHAARRNADILVIMGNNMIYGMTGGQVAPTTPMNVSTTTTPYGSFEHPIDPVRLSLAAGAAYAARWTTAHLTELRRSIKQALQVKGFRYVEVMTQCPVSYGRRAGFKDAGDMLRHFRDNAVIIKEAGRLGDPDLEGKIVLGNFVGEERPTLTETIGAVLRRGRQGAQEN